MTDKLFTRDEFQALIDSSYDGIHITDAEGVTLFYNKACEEIEGIKREDIIGKNVQHFVDTEVYPESITLAAIAKKERVNMFQNINGKLVMASATPFFDGEKQMKGIVVNSRDITSLNNLRDELEEAKHLSKNYHMELEQMKYRDIDSAVIARDVTMEKIIQLVMRVASVKSSVLIQGEPGAGKGVIARLIHSYSPVKDQPFMKLDCGTITETLLEAELFGRENGTAEGMRKGLLDLADGGTLFLDDIDELSLSLQSKLLTVIQEERFTRIGGSEEIPADVRIIAATNKNLEEMVKGKKFREELYYRLNIIPIDIPPLRKRRDDIYPLVMQNLKKVNKKYNLDKRIDAQAMDVLVGYHWPGNVRELENIVERLVVTSPESTIDYVDVPFEIKNSQIESLSFMEMDGTQSLAGIVANFEKQVLLNAMEADGDVFSMAKAFKVDPTTIRRKFHKYGIEFK
ncbi:sigma-54 interaction domain-containing protein [Lacicoccus alkaliphilus]|uniref:PAS domain S-box-containing protein n=1 Tax=Lacicoccus alkaliphilus DSM 16010 TaxID=1123231 RepID=A0A1M7JWI7_9BACL|nr:sigma 54-interacting transcriptional regulator [Salinicoccus alkaliphilus]SHM57396.1 PAS domain S-box-containing protein [Salinicoccus alkaliphilus DSM 16010]